MPSADACRREIEALHDLFVRWYGGEAERAEFERLERALDPSFELVSPDGTVSDRESVIAGVREEYDGRTGFDIEIRNPEPVHIDGEYALVRYEEWQSAGTGDTVTGRRSTALLQSTDAPEESGRSEPHSDRTRPVARWLYLQETWLDGPDSPPSL